MATSGAPAPAPATGVRAIAVVALCLLLLCQPAAAAAAGLQAASWEGHRDLNGRVAAGRGRSLQGLNVLLRGAERRMAALPQRALLDSSGSCLSWSNCGDGSVDWASTHSGDQVCIDGALCPSSAAGLCGSSCYDPASHSCQGGVVVAQPNAGDGTGVGTCSTGSGRSNKTTNGVSSTTGANSVSGSTGANVRGASDDKLFTIINRCSFTIWPGILKLPNSAMKWTAGIPGGATLTTDEQMTFKVPPDFKGRIWARTGCKGGAGSNSLHCEVGDCKGLYNCEGAGESPTTEAEIVCQATSDGNTFYDVSLVDGYNVGVAFGPNKGTYGPSSGVAGYVCGTPSCTVDLVKSSPAACPGDVLVSGLASSPNACYSACAKFGSAAYCCAGSYNSPQACGPSSYSLKLKAACPNVYTYAYDDPTSTFTCADADWTVTFCPLGI